MIFSKLVSEARNAKKYTSATEHVVNFYSRRPSLHLLHLGMADFVKEYNIEDFTRILKIGLAETDDIGSMAGLFVELLDAVTDFEGYELSACVRCGWEPLCCCREPLCCG